MIYSSVNAWLNNLFSPRNNQYAYSFVFTRKQKISLNYYTRISHPTDSLVAGEPF